MVNFEDGKNNEKRLADLELSINEGSRLKKQIEEQELERKRATQIKNKTVYYENINSKNNINTCDYLNKNINNLSNNEKIQNLSVKNKSVDVFKSAGDQLKPISSLDIINDKSQNQSNNLKNKTKLIDYSQSNASKFEQNRLGNNSILEVKNQDSLINPEETINKRKKFEEIIKDVDLNEIPELD